MEASGIEDHAKRARRRDLTTLAGRLWEARDRRDMRQIDLAKAAGLKQPDVSKIERGVTVQTAAIARLAAALDVPAAWLELHEGPEPDWSRKPELNPGVRGSRKPSPASERPPSKGGASLENHPLTTVPGRLIGSIGLALMEIDGLMGNGAPEGASRGVSYMQVDKQWIEHRTPSAMPENLALASGFDDSMRPTIEIGDTVLVDRAVQDAESSGVYVVRLNERLYINRLQCRPDGSLLMTFDNPQHQPYPIDRTAGRDRLTVLGQVVMIWNARRP